MFALSICLFLASRSPNGNDNKLDTGKGQTTHGLQKLVGEREKDVTDSCACAWLSCCQQCKAASPYNSAKTCSKVTRFWRSLRWRCVEYQVTWMDYVLDVFVLVMGSGSIVEQFWYTSWIVLRDILWYFFLLRDTTKRQEMAVFSYWNCRLFAVCTHNIFFMSSLLQKKNMATWCWRNINLLNTTMLLDISLWKWGKCLHSTTSNKWFHNGLSKGQQIKKITSWF